MASTQLADRFSEYMQDPLVEGRTSGTKIIPFYQNLAAITGSGKTLILADCVEQIRSRLPAEPIVLWLSKGKVVVWQTLTNLSTGKYADLLGGYAVKPLLDCKPGDVEDATKGLLLVATVAKFNQKEKEEGDRKIFRVGFDVADQSLWETLKKRRTSQGIKRPLIVVYDEGHNLSDQQTQLLLELEPNALIAASATMRVPEAMNKIIERLKLGQSWKDTDFVTAVSSAQVVESGLVKKHISLGGYLTSMEVAVNDLLSEMRRAEDAAAAQDLPFKPKAIYVSTTNAVDGATIAEDKARVFEERLARPILLWRHLVQQGVNPSDIAVYCDLNFDKKCPPPSNFNLFSKGDADYDEFMARNFRHIIFNLSLQEGWDDPTCCFAYIDKDMGSPDQVTQIVGRVLRQPGAQHYSSPILNTAHFFIRTDEKGVFDNILKDVQKKLTTDIPEVSISFKRVSKATEKPIRPALKERSVPTVSVNSAAAIAPIREIVRKIIDFNSHGNEEHTIGKGGRIKVLQTIGTGEDQHEEWVEIEHSNRVTARWIFLRELQKKHPKAARLCDIEHKKFDALIEYNSAAADLIRESADKVSEAYVKESEIVQNALDHPYVIEGIPVDESDFCKFNNAIHEGYSGLNDLEIEFASAIDKTKRVWCRNPTHGGFSIPLLDRGKTRNFHPDFLVWTNGHVVAIDTKGDHLIVEDAGRKLFFIEKMEQGIELTIRLVTAGKWEIRGGEFPKESGSTGFTVWFIKQGKIQAKYCKTAVEAVNACVEIDTAKVR
jgi:type III restriction enzyme